MKRSMSELKRKCKKAVETTEKKISETEDLRLELEEGIEKIGGQLRYENYVRGVRVRSARILIMSLKYRCLRVREYFNRIPQILLILTISSNVTKTRTPTLEHRYRNNEDGILRKLWKMHNLKS